MVLRIAQVSRECCGLQGCNRRILAALPYETALALEKNHATRQTDGAGTSGTAREDTLDERTQIPGESIDAVALGTIQTASEAEEDGFMASAKV